MESSKSKLFTCIPRNKRFCEHGGTVANDTGATTAEPSTRKSLFGGLGRPSNH